MFIDNDEDSINFIIFQKSLGRIHSDIFKNFLRKYVQKCMKKCVHNE